MEQADARVAATNDFIRHLSDYSHCITPYLRNIQEKYSTALYVVQNEPVDLNAYCKQERMRVEKAKEIIDAKFQ